MENNFGHPLEKSTITPSAKILPNPCMQLSVLGIEASRSVYNNHDQLRKYRTAAEIRLDWNTLLLSQVYSLGSDIQIILTASRTMLRLVPTYNIWCDQ